MVSIQNDWSITTLSEGIAFQLTTTFQLSLADSSTPTVASDRDTAAVLYLSTMPLAKSSISARLQPMPRRLWQASTNLRRWPAMKASKSNDIELTMESLQPMSSKTIVNIWIKKSRSVGLELSIKMASLNATSKLWRTGLVQTCSMPRIISLSTRQ